MTKKASQMRWPGCILRDEYCAGIEVLFALQGSPFLPCSVPCPLPSSWVSQWGQAGAQRKESRRHQVIHCLCSDPVSSQHLQLSQQTMTTFFFKL